MISELEIPAEVPLMTLEGVTLFPQAMIPLYIFEERYRHMLKEVLAHDRMFALAAINQDEVSVFSELDPPRKIAGVGMVRACRKNPDGTSNLILQGLARVECEGLVQQEPFRRIRIRPYPSECDGSEETLNAIQSSLIALVKKQMQLDKALPKEILDFLLQVGDPEGTLDLAIHTLCASLPLKLELFETRSILSRFEKFERYLRARIEQLRLERDLKKDSGGDAPEKN